MRVKDLYGGYPPLSGVKKILVIKLRHYGDVLLCSPVFLSLKEVMPFADIDAMVYAEAIPILEGHPSIRRIIGCDRKKKKLWGYNFQTLRNIRREKYDLVINLTEGDRGAIIAWASGAKIKVGFHPGNKGFLGKSLIYTHLAKNCLTPRHAVERNLDILRCIGIFPEKEKRQLYFYICKESRDRVVTLLKRGSILEGQYMLLHPGSRWRFKCAPTSLMGKLILELNRRGKQVVITGSRNPIEIQMAEEIVAINPGISVLNLTGCTSLKELGALIQMSRCMITVDSLALHLASALKSAVVALFGPSSHLNWGPWENPRSCVVRQDWSCSPCLMDGCGGSKRSDCLDTMPLNSILEGIDRVT